VSQRCLTWPWTRAVAGGLAALWLACGGEAPPQPPVPADLDDTDPAIVELFEAKAAAVRRAPGDPESWRRLGIAYHAHGRLALAAECYRRSLALGARPSLRGRAPSSDGLGQNFEPKGRGSGAQAPHRLEGYLYADRPDRNVTDALTADDHFRQDGSRPLLLEAG
jgi:hypothetical protein